ncbi:MAG TPA: HNH endonuclease family protein, partial [Hyphomicrobiaceae bacterium]|nr:HNH endonuclease family protein [Hyphomicrobiaceae bacterium]
ALPTAAQGSAPRRHRLALRGESADHLTSLALRPGATEQEAPEGEPPPGVSNMIAVREALGDALDELEDQELVALGDLIGSVCCIAVIETSHVDDAHRIFMVLNDRGKPLDRKDILKAEVLGRVALDQRQRCLVIWEERERLLGVGFEVLFGHIRAIHGRSGPRIIDGIRSIIAETGGAERFVDRVFAPAADALAAINHCRHEGSPHSAAICRRLRYLGWLTGTEWVPATLAFWLANPDKPEVLYAFLREIDRIAYTARLLGLGGDKRIARFDRLTDLVRSGRGLDTRLAPHVLTREELRNINYNLRSLHYRSQQTCKLVLMRLSDEIAGREENLDPADYTVEHVLPLNPGRTSSWRTVIPDAEERARVANLLGNLVLVPRALNADAGNLDLSAKLDLYFAAGRPRQPAITEQLRGLATWNADTIRARDADFASRLQRMWRLEDAPSEPATPPASGRPRRRGRARTSD